MSYPEVKVLLVAGMVLFAAGCAQKPLTGAYQLKKNAAMVIGRNEAVPTVWNEATPPVLGQVYYRNPQGSAQPTSSIFVHAVEPFTAKPLLLEGSPWVYDLTRKPDIEAQLGYMGVDANLSAKPVSTLHFSAVPGTLTQIGEWEDGLFTVLSDPALLDQSKLPAAVLRDMTGRRKPTDSHYWIVTSILTARDLKVTVTKEGNWKGSLRIADADKLKALVGAESVPSESLNVGDDGSHLYLEFGRSDVPLTVWIYPLSATQKGGKIELFADRGGKPISSSNLLK